MQKELTESRDFFLRRGDEFLTMNYLGNTTAIGIEELYQHFKARMLAEMAAPESEEGVRG